MVGVMLDTRGGPDGAGRLIAAAAGTTSVATRSTGQLAGPKIGVFVSFHVRNHCLRLAAGSSAVPSHQSRCVNVLRAPQTSFREGLLPNMPINTGIARRERVLPNA